jgi:hypothetical protein
MTHISNFQPSPLGVAREAASAVCFGETARRLEPCLRASTGFENAARHRARITHAQEARGSLAMPAQKFT